MKKLFLTLKVWIGISLLVLISCEEENTAPVFDIDLDDQQAAAVSLRGTWGIPSDISLPFGTTPTVLNDLLLEFRIDDNYQPSTFTATGAEYFFSTQEATWSWEEGSTEDVVLNNVEPVTRIKVMKEGVNIRLAFEYSNGRKSGVGQYGCTLTKISP